QYLSTGFAFPYNIPGVLNINYGLYGGTSYTSYYMFFYNWHVTEYCESGRTAVYANVSTAPAITAGNSSSGQICPGTATTLTATSSDPNYNYIWTPGNLSGSSVSAFPSA